MLSGDHGKRKLQLWVTARKMQKSSIGSSMKLRYSCPYNNQAVTNFCHCTDGENALYQQSFNDKHKSSICQSRQKQTNICDLECKGD
jgi:hypothetical protein